MMRMLYRCFAGLLCLSSGAAFASETVTYSYDAKGRLTQVVHARADSNPVTTGYSFDAADNRTAVSTTGSIFNSPPRPVVVVPLSGFKVIALPPG